ncbi:MAG: thiolase domain-containing protein [Candidatus Riflebacteria bacterium]|nr:thiolase domain-containing protein [Candidatus Riflebacteria bacterium]
MRDVAVVGLGMIKWGELWGKSLRTMAVEAGLAALDDAGTDRVDSLVVGCMSSGLFVGQEHLASLVADGLAKGPIPASRVESACASGGLAVKTAFMEVASGMSDFVLAIGVEKMTDVDGGTATYALGTAADGEYECFHGVTFPALYGMMARAHMHRYGTTREQLSAVAVKNHGNAVHNPHAQFPQAVTIEQVSSSVMVADPIRILDCSPVTDGAAAVLVCPLSEARKLKKHLAVKIVGVGHATDTIGLYARKEFTSLPAVRLSFERALKMAKKTREEISFAEVHDCFTIAEVIISEDLGFFEKGSGGKAVLARETALGGRIPINPSGGLKAKGHPVGATGVAQICEATLQLRGGCGQRQVKGAKVGLCQNMGGSGGSSIVHILEANE